MNTLAETDPRPVREYRVRDYSEPLLGAETDSSLSTKDVIGGVVAAIMTLGPLAATALFSV